MLVELELFQLNWVTIVMKSGDFANAEKRSVAKSAVFPRNWSTFMLLLNCIIN